MKSIQKHETLIQSHAMQWILAHDIANPKRLARIYRCLNREGVRLQYSVYLLQGDSHHIDKLIRKIRTMIDEVEDDVRVYALTENTKIWGFGVHFNSDGFTLSNTWFDKAFQNLNVVNDKIEQCDLEF